MTNGRQRMPDQPLATPGEPVGPPPTRHRRRGRRSHGGNSRAEILNAGRHEFAALGYRGASLRTIAARADVDPHLIAHYFGSKMQLLLAIAEPPFEPENYVSCSPFRVPIARLEAGRAVLGHPDTHAVADDDIEKG